MDSATKTTRARAKMDSLSSRSIRSFAFQSVQTDASMETAQLLKSARATKASLSQRLEDANLIAVKDVLMETAFVQKFASVTKDILKLTTFANQFVRGEGFFSLIYQI